MDSKLFLGKALVAAHLHTYYSPPDTLFGSTSPNMFGDSVLQDPGGLLFLRRNLERREVSRRKDSPSATRWWSLISSSATGWVLLSSSAHLFCPQGCPIALIVSLVLCVRASCLDTCSRYHLLITCCQLASTALGSHHPHCYLQVKPFHSPSFVGPGPKRRSPTFCDASALSTSILYICGKWFVLWMGLPQRRHSPSFSACPLSWVFPTCHGNLSISTSVSVRYCFFHASRITLGPRQDVKYP